MTTLNSVSDVIRLLRDIEQRSQQGGARLSQQDGQKQNWTAIDFQLADHNYLIPLTETREIFPIPNQITPVPRSQPWVYGIANLRGELLPLFDLKYFLYKEPTKVSKYSRILVLNHPELYSGVLVDAVFGLKHFQSLPESKTDITDSHVADYLNGNISQSGTHWDVFSFHKLAADPRFLNAAK